MFGFHRLANAVGAFLGAVVGGLLAEAFGWRVPFFVFVIPSIVFVVLGLRLREPGRGHHERRAAGASEEVIATDEQPPSWAESVRILWQIRTLRRIWFSLPFLAASVIGLASLTSIYYEEVFGLSESQRGFVAGISEPAQVVGILIGIPLASRLMLRDPGLGLRLLSIVAVGIAGAWVAFALAPVLAVAVIANVLITGMAALLAPGIFASLSLAIPPKARSLGFSMASLFILPGLTVLYIVGGIADRYGVRQGMLIMVPVFLVGAAILSTAGSFVKADINRVWTSTAAQAEVRLERSRGEVKLLLVRNVDVSYDNVQVLFGVNFEIDEGEIVALLGTNGAGKSTLLKTIAGVVPADGGAIVFDGRDATYAPPHEIAARGIVMVPGGQGVFPSLTVDENLRLAGWLDRDETSRAQAVAHVLEMFPSLEHRMQEPAANLSGGQQQMLTLSMALLSRPRLLMIDELSLGLAPSVVAELLVAVQRLKEQGTTVILVEQSVNVALTVAETAYFMEKGEIRFHGPTSELLERPDVLRSVFLEGAASVELAIDAPAVVHVEGAVPRGTRAPLSANGADAQGDVRVRVQGVSKHFGGIAALDDVSFDVTAGEVLGFLGPNGAGKTTLFDVMSGFQVPEPGRHRARGDVHRRLRARRTGPPRARAVVPGRAALPRPHRGRDDRRRARAQHRRARPHRGGAPPPVGDGLRGQGGRAGRGAHRAAGSRRVPRQVHPRALHRQSARRRPGLRAGARTTRPPARRAVVGDRAAGGRGARPAAPPDPRHDGREPAHHRARHPAAHVDRGSHDRARPGRVVTIGAPADVVRDPDVVASYLGESEAVVSRSGPRGG